MPASWAKAFLPTMALLNWTGKVAFETTFDALLRLRNANTVAQERGVSLEKVFNG